MGHMIIDGRKVEFTDEKNVLSVIRKAGINIPTLCYHSEVSTFGACRLCTVEDERGKTFASCSEQPRDGMVIYTNSGRVKKYRKLIVELLLAAHCRDCTTCVKSGECVLQELAHRLGVQTIRFKNTREYHELDTSSPSLVRDPNKCILCGDCVRACEELQGIGALGFAFRGTEAMVMPAFNKKIAETECVNCGQCRVYSAAVCVLHPILVLSEIHPPVYPSAVPHRSVQAPASHLPKQYLLLSAVLPHRSIPAFLHRSEFPVSAEYPSVQSVPPSVPAEDLVHLQAALPADPYAASAPDTGHSSLITFENYLLSAALQAVQDFPDSGDQKL